MCGAAHAHHCAPAAPAASLRITPDPPFSDPLPFLPPSPPLPPQVRSRRQLQQRAAVLAKLRESGDITGLSFALRLDYLRQAGSASTRWGAPPGAPPRSSCCALFAARPLVWLHTTLLRCLHMPLRGTCLPATSHGPCSALMEAAGHCPVLPAAVERYIEEVKRCLHHIASCPGAGGVACRLACRHCGPYVAWSLEGRGF